MMQTGKMLQCCILDHKPHRPTMSHEHSHPHHEPPQPGPVRSVLASGLALRLAVAGAGAAMLWLSVGWALA